MKVIEGLYYSADHEWLKVEGERGYVGITDFAQHSLGDIVFVELPEVDSEFAAGESFGTVESVKAASDVLIPVSGKVVEVNEEVVDDPALINQDPYENWMICIEINEVAELDQLMSAAQYEEFCSKEE